jgi:hypothetical protein
MTKKRRNEVAAAVLVALAIFAIYYFDFQPSAPRQQAEAPPDAPITPIAVENPALRVDLLKQLDKVQYTGQHRNIFSETPPPPPVEDTAARHSTGPQPPPPPPPLAVNLKFYGYVSDRSTGVRRAFFTDGDDVFIAAEGDTLESGRYRLLHIGNDSAELEELSSGRRAVVNIEPEQQTQ